MHLLFMALLAFPNTASRAPDFRDFSTAITVVKRIAGPRLQTKEERKYTDILQNAATKGYGVVQGGTEEERPGINFAGHFLLVQWSCGLACRQAAVIDALDGTVLRLPRASGTQLGSFHVPTFTGTVDLRDLHFRADSALLVMPNKAGSTSFFVLSGHLWRRVTTIKP